MRFFVFFLLVLSAVPYSSYARPASNPDGMTVGEAYQTIPHHQTTFDARGSKIPPADAAFLKKLFMLTDQAVVGRVLGMEAASRKQLKPSLRYYKSLVKDVDALKPPANEKLKKVQQLVVDAIHEHQQYFDEQTQAAVIGYDSENPLVNSSSQKLKDAYDILVETYPSEITYNKFAFYDHLGALDFKNLGQQ